jgi:RimJ/RimL family protein N-acetyltransferase
VIEASLLEDRCEVGFMLGVRHWGRSYASEALAWLHAHVRATYPTVTAFWATVLPGNARSATLLERFGYTRYEGALPVLTSYDPGDWVYRLE